MKEVCVSLNIPSLEVNFVKDYWLSVFAPFVEDFQSTSALLVLYWDGCANQEICRVVLGQAASALPIQT